MSLSATAIATPKKPTPTPLAQRNWTGLIMTALVVVSTVGGVAYSLGYGRGRSRNIAVSEPQRDRPSSAIVPVKVYPEVIAPTQSIELDRQEDPKESHSGEQTVIQFSDQTVIQFSEQTVIQAPDTQGSQANDAHNTAPVNETTRLAKVDIVEELIRDLQNPNPSDRRKAIWDLGQQGDSRAIQPMVDLMMDSDSSQRSLILASISEIGIRTLKPVNRALLLSLQDDSSDVRKNGIRDVTRIYDLVAQISQLLQHAVSDPDQEVQETATWALNQLNRIRPLSSADSRPALPNGLHFKELGSAIADKSGE